jgi:hypothetical protein
MNFFELNDDNILIFAIKNYDNPDCKSMTEFEEDMSRCVYLKRLFRKYHKTGELKERLILNHLITFYNVFGVQAATKILFYKIDSELHYILKTFLIYLNYIPTELSMNDIYLVNTPMDEKIIQILRKL